MTLALQRANMNLELINLANWDSLEKAFDNQDLMDCWFQYEDLDCVILEAVFRMTVPKIRRWVAEECLGCVSKKARAAGLQPVQPTDKCDFCQLNVQTLFKSYWQVMLDTFSHQDFRSALFESWDQDSTMFTFAAANMCIPYRYLEDDDWIRERLADEDLKNYWITKLSYWYAAETGGRQLFKMTINQIDR